MKPPFAYKKHREHPTAFALLMTLLLLTLVAATGMSLSFLSGTESIRTAYAARTLSHELALDSLIVCLPEMLRANREADPLIANEGGARQLLLVVGECRIECFLQQEKSKFRIDTNADDASTLNTLAELASEYAKNPECIHLRPILEDDSTKAWPRYYWFDQIVDARELGEVFSCQNLTSAKRITIPKAWSELVTFWSRGKHLVLSLQVKTTIGSDSRHWYIVCRLSENSSEVLCRKAAWL